MRSENSRLELFQINPIMIQFAFDNLVSRFDEITVVEPRSFKELTEIFFELQNILCELEEIIRIIGSSTSFNED